jgi:hypothetical protein
MPAHVTVNDDRWQFIAGNKYWVIGTIEFSGNYETGGIPVTFTPSPPPPIGELRQPPEGTIKASRAPWFSIISNAAGRTFSYISPAHIFGNFGFPTINTVGTAGRTDISDISDINRGLLQASSGGTEVANNTNMSAWPKTTGLFIFQGME